MCKQRRARGIKVKKYAWALSFYCPTVLCYICVRRGDLMSICMSLLPTPTMNYYWMWTHLLYIIMRVTQTCSGLNKMLFLEDSSMRWKPWNPDSSKFALQFHVYSNIRFNSREWYMCAAIWRMREPDLWQTLTFSNQSIDKKSVAHKFDYWCLS